MPWPLIVFLGGALNIGILLKQVCINKWLQELLLPIFSIVDNTWLLILVVAVSVMLLRLLLISLMATITLTMTVLLPVFQAAGICPLGIGFVIYATMLCWFTPYQNLVFLSLIHIWCNYQRTYKENNLARVALVKAGLPDSVPGITVHRNCTSSMSSVQLGYYQIKAGEAKCIFAGGADSMSTAPHMVFNARYGQKFGHMELRDSMWDSRCV